MPENFQYGEKGEAAEEAVSCLDYAIDQRIHGKKSVPLAATRR